jgi:hypothetical protein
MQPQVQSQAPAQDSPFAILLAALSAQGMPAGEDAGADASSDATAPDSLPDAAGQSGKPAPAAAEKSNAADHVAQAALAALLNTPAAPPPFSRPSAETSETAPSVSIPDAAASVPAEKDKPKSTAENPAADADGPSTSAAIPFTGAPADPMLPVSGNTPVTPASADAPVSSDAPTSESAPASGNTAGTKIADASPPSASPPDASPPDAPVDPVPAAAGSDPVVPPIATGSKPGPKTKIADASTAAPNGKAEAAEKKLTAPEQSEADAVTGAEALPAMVAMAAAGQPSTDQAAKLAATIDTSTIANIAADTGAKPAKDVIGPGPVFTTQSEDEAPDPSAAIDASPENAVSLSTLATVATKPAAPPVKSTDAKSAPNKDAAPDAPVTASRDRPPVPAPAQNTIKAPSHAAAQKTEASAPSSPDDSAKPVQADSTPVAVPAAAAATAHAAPPSQPAAIIDPSIIVAPHAVPGSPSDAAPAAKLEITNAGSDPVPDLNGFAVSIAARSLSGAKQFEIRLDPPELGRVDVRLSIDAAGKAVAHMTADQPQALDLLRKDAPALTQALRDAGLDVSQNGLNFSLRGQDRQNGDSGGQSRRSNLSARLAIQAAQAPAAFAYAGAASSAHLDIHV